MTNPNKGEEIDWEKGYGKPPKEYPYTDEEVEFLKKYPGMTLAFVHAKGAEAKMKDHPLEKEWSERFDEEFERNLAHAPTEKDWLTGAEKQKEKIKSFIKQVLSSEAVLKGERRRIIAQIKEEVLEDYKAELLGKIEGKIKEELEAKPADDVEKTAEWYKISALQDIKAIISEKKV